MTKEKLMITVRPTKDLNRLRFLTEAADHMNTCVGETEFVPFACLVERFNSLPVEFDAAMHGVRRAQTKYRKAISQRLEKTEELSRCCRDFYASLVRRTERDKHGNYVLDNFKMPFDANLPKISQTDAWVLIADDLIEGDAGMVTDGFPAMTNPGCEDLQRHIQAVKEAKLAVKHTHTTRQRAQRSLTDLREEADQMFRKLYHYLVGWLVDENPGVRRDTMRKFGYVFQSDNSEATENIQEPAAPEPETNQTAPPEIPDQIPETSREETEMEVEPVQQTPPPPEAQTQLPKAS